MRLWYQSMTPIARLPGYAAALQSHARDVCSPGVEVAVHGVSDEPYQGLMPADLLKYPYAKLVLQVECIELARRAQREGFDAFIIGSFSEPFLQEIRSLLDIPVVSMAEATLFIAASLAEKFALVTLAAPNVKRVRAIVERHGMAARVLDVYPLDKRVDEADLEAALVDGAQVVADFKRVAARAIEAGADVVVPAEGVLNEVVRASGLRTLADATILDCVGATLLHAELLVTVKRRMGLGVGRRWAYAKPPAELLDRLHLAAQWRKQ